MWLPSNTWFLGPTQVQIQMESRLVQSFLHSSWQRVPILCNGPPLFPPLKLIAPSLGVSGPHPIVIPWANPSPQPKWHLNRFSCFCTPHRGVSLCALQWAAPLPVKIPPPVVDLDPHLIHGSSGPLESSTQTASRSLELFLQGSLLWQTDRPTDHTSRSVTIGCICVHSTTMWPENWLIATSRQ